MRRIGFFFLCTTVLAAAVFDCVGSDNPPVSGGDGGADSGSPGTDSGTAGDSSTADSGGPATDGGDAGLVDQCIGHIDCPSNIETTNLELWLRGDVGVTCAGGRVSKWADQSGHAHDATPGTHDDTSAALSAKCDANVIGGRAAITFDAPSEPDGGDGGEFTQFVDGTMQTNLDLVYNGNYTLMIVQRRAVDGAFGVIGQDNTVEPGNGFVPGLGQAHLCALMGGTSGPQDVFSFLYEPITGGGGGNTISYSQGCGAAGGTTDTFSANKVELVEIVYDSTTGHIMYSNGAIAFQGGGSKSDLAGVNEGVEYPGVIGRSFNRYAVDSRYQGDIAEIIGYSTNLTDMERQSIEGYLKREWGLSF